MFGLTDDHTLLSRRTDDLKKDSVFFHTQFSITCNVFCLKHECNFEGDVSFLVPPVGWRLEGEGSIFSDLLDGQGRPVGVPGGRKDGPEASLSQLLADRVETLEGLIT